jgi:hypothetical protein
MQREMRRSYPRAGVLHEVNATIVSYVTTSCFFNTTLRHRAATEMNCDAKAFVQDHRDWPSG